VTPTPLPLAPRPYPGEAISSWLRRIAARYDILADHLARYVLGWTAYCDHPAERLDYRADAVLEASVASATRVDLETIQGMRIVPGDGSAAGWHRARPTWCRACLDADLAERGEVCERAMWRLGCCVLCPEHAVPLEDGCHCCWPPAPCRFQGVKGRLRLACGASRSLLDPVGESRAAPNMGRVGDREVEQLVPVLERFQDDLRRALATSPPRQSWGLVRTGRGLATAVRDLTLAIILATRIKFEPPIEVVPPRPGQAFTLIHLPVTPAVLLASTALNVLARVAAVLRTLPEGDISWPQWLPDPATELESAASFVTWLPSWERRLLATLSTEWEQPAGDAIRTLIAQRDNPAQRARA
jgi:hypothetical protein